MDFRAALASSAGQAAVRTAGKVAAAAVGVKLVSTLNTMLSNYYQGNPVLSWCRAPKDWRDWSKEIVLITGASSGIGRAMVAGFVRRGITVVAVDINEPRPQDKELFKDVRFYKFDVTDSDGIAALVHTVRSDVGDPTVLINNAGVFYSTTLLAETPAQIQHTLDVNVVAPLLLTRAFLPAMIAAKHGHIMTTASLASFVTVASNIDYSCSKVGLLGLYEGLSQELRWRYNCPMIRTSIVHPYWVETPILMNHMEERPHFRSTMMSAEFVAEKMVAHVVSGRSGQLVLPASLNVAGYLRALPIWLQEMVRNSKAMDLYRE